MLYRCMLILFFTTLLSTPVLAQLEGWGLEASVRLRSEVDGRDFSNNSYALTYSYLRSRLAVTNEIGGFADLKIQVQDTRLLGEERGSISDIGNTDVHQAYLRFNDLFGLPMTVQAGRFQMPYANQRLFAVNNWNNIGRAFDGFRFTLDLGFTSHLFATNIEEYVGSLKSSVPPYYPQPLPSTQSYRLYGTWNIIELTEKNDIHLFGYYEIDEMKSNGVDNDIQRFTVGANHFGMVGGLDLTLEAAIQTGSIRGMDLATYMAAADLRQKTSEYYLGGGAVVFSGTAPEDAGFEYNSFANTFGTGHGFYGRMDIFSSKIQNQSGGLGLHDFYLVGGLTPEGKWAYKCQLHFFTSNQESAGGETVFGQEFDVEVRYSLKKSVFIEAGGALFLPGALMKEFMGNDPDREDAAFWGYLMLNVKI